MREEKEREMINGDADLHIIFHRQMLIIFARGQPFYCTCPEMRFFIQISKFESCITCHEISFVDKMGSNVIRQLLA